MNTMTAVQANNLRILADHMDGLKRILNMYFITDCGTPACALGEACAMPQFIKAGLRFDEEDGLFIGVRNFSGCEFARVGSEFFGLTIDEAVLLFGTPTVNAWHSRDVTGLEWAAEARRILAAHGYPAVVPGELACVDYCPKPVCTCTDPAHPTAESAALLQRLTAPVRVRG